MIVIVIENDLQCTFLQWFYQIRLSSSKVSIGGRHIPVSHNWPQAGCGADPQHRGTNITQSTHQVAPVCMDTTLVSCTTAYQALRQNRVCEACFPMLCAICLELSTYSNHSMRLTTNVQFYTKDILLHFSTQHLAHTQTDWPRRLWSYDLTTLYKLDYYYY